MKDELKQIRDAEEAAAARKRPRQGVTVASLGTHHFSTEPVLTAAKVAKAASKGKGKGKTVIRLVVPDSGPSGDSVS